LFEDVDRPGAGKCNGFHGSSVNEAARNRKRAAS
jgi:hypothetical protein